MKKSYMNSWNSLEAYVVVGFGVSCRVRSGVSGLVVSRLWVSLVGGHSGDQEGDNDELEDGDPVVILYCSY